MIGFNKNIPIKIPHPKNYYMRMYLIRILGFNDVHKLPILIKSKTIVYITSSYHTKQLMFSDVYDVSLDILLL